jgi:hypothetical protein
MWFLHQHGLDSGYIVPTSGTSQKYRLVMTVANNKNGEGEHCEI